MDKKFELLCIFRQFVSHTCLVLVKNCRRPPRGGVSRNIGEFTCDRIYELGRPTRGGEQKQRRWKGRERISPPSFLRKIFARGSLLT